MIADSQVHIWGDESPDRPWVPGGQERLRHMGHLPSLGGAELVAMMDAAGVDRAVIVPPTWDRDRLDVALDACERWPGRFCIMARIPLDRPAEARALLDGWRDQPHVRGVRLTFSFPDDRAFIEDGTADWFWPLAEERDIPVMLLVPHAKPKLAEIARRHPGLRLAVDHLGIFGNTVDADVAPYVDATLELAAIPNICVKLSNLPSFSTGEWPYRNLHGHIRRLVEAFGPERCFWGTDISRMLGKYGVDYAGALAMIREEMPFLDTRARDEILGRALCRWLRWPPQQGG